MFFAERVSRLQTCATYISRGMWLLEEKPLGYGHQLRSQASL